MGDYDPLYKKVGNVYDKQGNRIGTIRSTEVNGGLSFLVGCGMIIAVIVAIVYGIIGGFTSLGNLVAHGEWTTDSLGAEVRDHLSEPNYFSDRAAAAQVAIQDTKCQAHDGDIQCSIAIVNNGTTEHEVITSPGSVSFINNKKESSTQLCAGANEVQRVAKVPAHSTVQVARDGCGFYKTLREPIQIIKPIVVQAIDELPLSGGPANTPWHLTNIAYGTVVFG